MGRLFYLLFNKRKGFKKSAYIILYRVKIALYYYSKIAILFFAYAKGMQKNFAINKGARKRSWIFSLTNGYQSVVVSSFIK